MKNRSKEDEVADIKVNSINKYYGDVHVIKDISLEIKSLVQVKSSTIDPSGLQVKFFIFGELFIGREF